MFVDAGRKRQCIRDWITIRVATVTMNPRSLACNYGDLMVVVSYSLIGLTLHIWCNVGTIAVSADLLWGDIERRA